MSFKACTRMLSSKHIVQSIHDHLQNIPPSQIFSKSIDERYFAKCLKCLDDVTLQDVGLSEEGVLQFQRSACAVISQTRLFDIAVFILPAGSGLPMHDHPGMTVLSKVLLGELAMRAFTLDGTEQDVSSSTFPASQIMACTKSPRDPAWYLTPTRGNIHEFIAKQTTVVLDCLLPPYSYPDRPCSFYTSENCHQDSHNFLLRQIPIDNSLLPELTPYNGYKPKAYR